VARVPLSIATIAGTGAPVRLKASMMRASRHASRWYTMLGSPGALRTSERGSPPRTTSTRQAPLE
jgi:hypothetical protein